MRLRLALARLPLPAFVKKRGLRRLAALTADAFDLPAPDVSGRSYSRALAVYADFTREAAGRLAGGDWAGKRVQAALFRGAFALGARYRRLFRIRDAGEALVAMRALYRAIGIRMERDGREGFTVRSCFFSSRYDPATCQVISALDAGLLAGLAGGGGLSFSQRLTEGAPCCRATFTPEAGE